MPPRIEKEDGRGDSEDPGHKYPPTPESFRRQGEAVAAFDARKILCRIRAPTLIVNGTRDPFVPANIARELAAGIAGARLVLAEGDHMMARSRPELLVEPALAFLAGGETVPGSR